MLQALRSLARVFSRDENQLSLELAPARRPTTSAELEAELRRRGLGREYRVTLTRNRTVVVSYGRGELRIHRSFLDAPEEIWRAVIVFVHGRTRAGRAEARRTILNFPITRDVEGRRPRRAHSTLPEDAALAKRLADCHAEYNQEHFGGELRTIPIGISRRMRSRLGHYSPAGVDGHPSEIMISRRHFRRHGWEETAQTLLHEMVHQWQDENQREIDHGREFRRKAQAVGIAPHATRRVA